MSAIEVCERVTVQVVNKHGPTILIPGWKFGGLAAVCRPVPYSDLQIWAIVTIDRGLYCFGGASFISCEDACGAIVGLVEKGISPADCADEVVARETIEIIRRHHGILLSIASRADGQAWVAAGMARTGMVPS